MFLENYLDEFYYNEVIDNYDYNYLCSLNYNNFKDIYNILVKNNFNYINDIILKYLELFELEPMYVDGCINGLKQLLGNNYVNIISNDMRYFGLIIDNYNDEE